MEIRRVKHLGILLIIFLMLSFAFFACIGAGFMILAQTDITSFRLYVSTPASMTGFLAISMTLAALIYKSVLPKLRFIQDNYKNHKERYVNIIILFPLFLLGAFALLLFADIDAERHLAENIFIFPFALCLLYGILHFSVFADLDKKSTSAKKQESEKEKPLS